MEKVTIFIPLKEDCPQDQYETIFVQGKRVQIKKGAYVEVPKIYKDILEITQKTFRTVNSEQKELVMEG